MPTPFIPGLVCYELQDRLGRYWGHAQRHCGRFLDQRAIGLACELNGGDAYVMWGRPELWRKALYEGTSARTIWLRADALAPFAETVLPTIPGRFVLVTTESDYSPFRWQRRAAETLLASDKVAHWFCAQCDMPEGTQKVTRVPLGIPYPHRNEFYFGPNPFDARQYRWVRRDTPGFDRWLGRLVAGRIPTAKRRQVAFADFALNDTSGDLRHGESRRQIADRLASRPDVIFPGSRLSRRALYEAYAQAAFVVSPHGKGLDCYRTWEAILLGAIPIVKRSALDPVYEGFPVVILDDWSQIDAASMRHWADQFSRSWDNGAMEERLSLARWKTAIADAAAAMA